MGARRIGVFSTPPIGCVPSQRTLAGGIERECAADYNVASRLFNKKLIAVLDSLQTSLPDGRFVYIDIYNPLLELIENPKKLGIYIIIYTYNIFFFTLHIESEIISIFFKKIINLFNFLCF